jgi:putative transposase
VDSLKENHRISERGSCRAVKLSRSVYHYEPKPKDDSKIVEGLEELVEDHPDLGFGKLFEMLRRKGHRWNHKRVYRVYKGMKLNKKRKFKRRLPVRNPEPLTAGDKANISWSVDFMSDSLTDSGTIQDLQRDRRL